MSEVLKLIVSLSLSGSVLILILLLLRPLLRDRISKRWQYYIWLLVIARLLLPIGPPESPAGDAVITMNEAAVSIVGYNPWHGASNTNPEYDAEFAEPEPTALQEFAMSLWQNLWVIWLIGALVLLIRKVTAYQSFVRYIRTGWTPVDDPALLDRIAEIGAETGVKKPIELYVNPLSASPMLLGVRKPCVVLPSVELPEEDLRFVFLHELTHYRYQDMLYKWLVQITVCVHWFNPLVHWMAHETERLCELSCDEAVLEKLDAADHRAYGDALLRTITTGGGCKPAMPSATLGESGKLLKERLDTIMKFKKPTRLAAIMSILLAIVLAVTATAAGAYTGVSIPAADDQNFGESTTTDLVEGYYESHNLPMFKTAFAMLSKPEQASWLSKIYKDNDIAFFSAAADGLKVDSDLVKLYAEKAYVSGDISYFSVLLDRMSEEAMESWLVRAKEDRLTSFQWVLMQHLDKDEELEKLEAELDRKQDEEYRAVGVTRDGGTYYYQGEKLYIFLDCQPDSSFYTMAMNPKAKDGKSVKIVRDASGKITGTAYLTEAEIAELFGDKDDKDWNDDWDDLPLFGSKDDTCVVDVDIDSVENGEYVWLGTFELKEGDIVYYNVSAEAGERLDVGFAKSGERKPDTTYMTVSNHRNDGELEVRSGPMDWQAADGTYSLFVHTRGGELKNVSGYVTIVKAAE